MGVWSHAHLAKPGEEVQHPAANYGSFNVVLSAARRGHAQTHSSQLEPLDASGSEHTTRSYAVRRRGFEWVGVGTQREALGAYSGVALQ